MSKSEALPHSWDELDTYRGEVFTGEWPTIPDMVEITASKFPDRPCFTVFNPEKTTLSYSEAVKKIKYISLYLSSLGMRKGDRIAVTGKNSPEWAAAYLAVLFTGCVVVPIDYQLSTEQAANLISFAGCRLVFTDHEKQVGLSKLLADSQIDHIFSLEAGYADYCMEFTSRKKYCKPDINEYDLAAILFTSGTTGNEKGVMLSHGNVISDVYQACDPAFLTASERDVFYALLPLHHSYAMTAVFLESLKHGSELVFGKAFIVKKIIADMQQAGVTVFMGIPLIYNKFLAGVMKKIREKGLVTYGTVRILMFINGILKRYFGRNPGRNRWFKPILEGLGFSRINFCISGGGPLPARTFNRFQQLGLDFVQGYGLTETAPIVTLNPKHRFKLSSVGKVLPFIDVKIDRPDITGTGEILVRGPNVTRGYYNDETATRALFTRDGYLITGDLGYLDKENYLYLRGRKKNLIVTEGGKNVYPEEIEDQFQLFPAIEQIMVRGYIMDKAARAEGIEALIFPSADYFGERKADEEFVNSEIHQAVKEVNQKFPSYKKITRVTVLKEAMDMTSTKKIQRSKVLAQLDSLRERYITFN
jgi:long-chain acyl-CoA synthetase